MATSDRRPSAWRGGLTLATALVSLQPATTLAQSSTWWPDSVGAHYALNEFRDTTTVSAAWQKPTADVWLLRTASHVDLEFGLIHAPGDIVGTVQLSPVWRWPFRQERYFVDFRFGPMLITTPEFGESDMGGNVHFSSKLSIGWRFGENRQHGLAVEISHTSNFFLDRPNPGLDLVGLTYWRFAD